MNSTEQQPLPDSVRAELEDLSNKIHNTMHEVACIRHPMMDHDRVLSAVDELEAIVTATEVATSGILEAAESLEGHADKLTAEGRAEDAERVSNDVTKIYEACNFQDITGQRIHKVMTLLREVDERLMAMIDHYGEEDFVQHIPVPEFIKQGDAGLLNGPALANGLAQDNIDALFD